MKVITVANQKGGTGKSTIAFNLAIAAMRDGLKTLLVNADLQQTALDVALVRAESDIKPTILVANITSDVIHTELPKKYKETYDMAIIDTGGRDSKAFRSAMAAADVVLIPLLPSAPDLWASQGTIKIAQEIQKARPNAMHIFCLLNQQVRNTIIGEETVEILKNIGALSLGTILHYRQAYKRSFAEGKGVIEYKDREAVREIEALWEEVCIWL